MEINEQAINSNATTAEEAAQMLGNLCEKGFSNDVSKLALALGRDEDEILDYLNGDNEPDEDLVMKIRGIAQERGIEIE